jgi:hypothetical protein
MDPIGDRIANSCFRKSTETRQATVTLATRRAFQLVTGPRSVRRLTQFHAALYDFPFSHADHRCDNFNMSFGTRALARQLLEDSVILRTAIGVAGTSSATAPKKNTVAPMTSAQLTALPASARYGMGRMWV